MAALQVLSGAGMYSSFVGEGEARLRAAFARARAVAPSTLFLDELDGFVGDDQSIMWPNGAMLIFGRLSFALVIYTDSTASICTNQCTNQ